MIRRGLKRDILILLAMIADEVYANSFKNQLRRMYCDGWYQKSSFGPTMAKLLSVGEIERVEKKGQLFYRLTSQGFEKLKEEIPILDFSGKPWDGRWRIVIFDIKEENKILREALRSKLLSLGFGMWQRSVYITPHPIEQEINQYLKSKKLFPFAFCLVAKRSQLGNDKILANYVWKLDKINEEYEEFIVQCQRLSEKLESKEGDFGEIRKLWLKYKELIFKDPHLPKELLPDNWLRDKSRLAFLKLYQKAMRSQSDLLRV